MPLSCFVILAALTAAQPEELPATQPETQPATRPAEPEWVLSRTHYPPDVEDENAYYDWCVAKRDALFAKADSAADPLEATRHRLAAANVVLALQIEPPVSRWCLDIPRPGDAAAIRSGIEEAKTLLDRIAEALAAPPETEVEKAAGSRAALEALQAFTAALESALGEGTGDEAASARQSAIAGLAIYLEAERREVATAALLWQAVLYRRLGQVEPALQVLPAPTARVGREARFFQFQARLLRCRMIAQRGGYAATAALLLQVEEKALEWFTVESEQDAAVHAAMLARLQALNQWRTSLDPTKEAEAIAWCDKAAARLKTEATTEGNPVFVLGLERAIPIFAAIDADEELEDEQEGQAAPES